MIQPKIIILFYYNKTRMNKDVCLLLLSYLSLSELLSLVSASRVGREGGVLVLHGNVGLDR